MVDLFAKQFGRIRCVAKGYRRPNKKGGTQTLFPYTEHQFSWQGRGDLKTLTQAETLQTPRFLKNECLYAGLYVNAIELNHVGLLQKLNICEALCNNSFEPLDSLETCAWH